MHPPSNVRVSVQFHKPVFFAGDHVECTITFKNVAGSSPPPSLYDLITPRLVDRRQPSTVLVNHRLPPDVVAPSRPSPLATASTKPSDLNSQSSSSSPAKKHARSVSTVPLASTTSSDSRTPNNPTQSAARSGTTHHARARSMQHPAPTSGSSSAVNGSTSAAPTATESPHSSKKLLHRTARSYSVRPAATSDISFPLLQQSPDPKSILPSPLKPESHRIPSTQVPSHHVTITNGLATYTGPESIASGTPRSSFDIHSMSNLSDDTLMSDYPLQPVVRQSIRDSTRRAPSRLLNPTSLPTGPEKLMIGYAQVTGSLVVDEKLVDHSHFEDIKRKAVIGGHGGGGVVGIKRSKNRGLFGTFGLSRIGESIGDILGTNEPSSIREMRHNATSRSIPVITTPPSIIFVNLDLNPGHVFKYSFKFALPMNLPPSHRASEHGLDLEKTSYLDGESERDRTVIKFVYTIRIRVQRPGRTKFKVQSLRVPFRVSSNPNGGDDCYNLLKPNVFLTDVASVNIIQDIPKEGSATASSSDSLSFLNYARSLLQESSKSVDGLLSPTTNLIPRSRNSLSVSLTTSDLAPFVALSNTAQPVHFPIRLSMHFAGRIVLLRKAFRLGETIPLVVDFDALDPQAASDNASKIVPVYEVAVSLVSYEMVDRSIASQQAIADYEKASQQQPASLIRMLSGQQLQQGEAPIIVWHTRRVHVQFSESVHFARRVAFALPIPLHATPEFSTSGISLRWLIRVDLVTPVVSNPDNQPQGRDDSGTTYFDINDGNDNTNVADHVAKRKHKPQKSTSNDHAQKSNKIPQDEAKINDENLGVKRGKLETHKWASLLQVASNGSGYATLHGVDSLAVQTWTYPVPIQVLPGLKVEGSKSENDVTDLPI